MNEILKQSFEQRQPFISDLPETNLNFSKSIATGMSVLAVAGVGAAGVTRPEQASAQGVDCSAPSGEVSTINTSKIGEAGADLRVGSIAMSSKACVGGDVTFNVNIRNTGTTNTGSTQIGISGPSRTIDNIKTVTHSIGSNYRADYKVVEGEAPGYGPYCEKIAIQGEGAKEIVCGRKTYMGLAPGQEQSIEFTIPITDSLTGNTIKVTGLSWQEDLVNGRIGNESERSFDIYSADGSTIVRRARDKNNDPTYSDPSSTQCPTRPNFNAIYNKSSKTTSFYYKAKPGQVIKGNTNLKQLDTPAGRSKMSRVEYIPAGKVDPKKLPKHARKVGNKIVMALTKNANSSAYQGLKMKYSPKSGTFAKLILPNSPKSVTYTKNTNNKNCVSGYPTIYAQNLIGK